MGLVELVLGDNARQSVDASPILGHLVLDTTEVGSSLHHLNLEALVGPSTGVLVLGSELGRELGTASGGTGLGLGILLVEHGNSRVERLGGGLGIAHNLGSILVHGSIGLANALVDGRL